MNCRNKFKKMASLATLLVGVFSLQTTTLAADLTYVTNDTVNFRLAPSTDSQILNTLSPGTNVVVVDTNESWTKITFDDQEGYMKTEFLSTKEEYATEAHSNVELLNWPEAKSIFTVGVDAKVEDVRTGKVYYVRSFSNGNHADVETITKNDTSIMKSTYGGAWSWDCRPILVTINGHTMAASINGMPHGGGVNSENNMDGQVCIHFKGSTTHNGNRSHERDHQSCVMEAYNSAN